MLKSKTSLQTSTYYVQGMHCASCEILIEKKIIKEDSVEAVDASLSEGAVVIKHRANSKITPEYLNKIFKEDGYCFSSIPFKKSKRAAADGECVVPNETTTNSYTPIVIAAAFIIGYILLSKTGFSSLISVNGQSSLPVFFLFGLLAGISSCAALVGGIILSLSKQWLSIYSQNDSTLKKAEPHFLFNFGRVVGYGAFGGILGAAGNFFRLSPVFSAMLVIAVSLVMVLLGLQMIGVKALQRFQIRLPKSLTGKLSDESNFRGRFGPFLMGALTFFLPCGFTITTQALALASGNPLQGALIMGIFALGTVPGLLAIGLSSVKFCSNPKSARQFSLIAGMLVLFFAAFNINTQLSVLGVSNVDDLISSPSTTQVGKSLGELPPLVNGTQVVKIDASSSGYTPNRIRLRANTPTRWEVSTNNISGCTNAIISRGLFDGQIDLVDGQVSTKEFTSPKPGVYKFSCWMGMVTGTVEVVDASGSTGTDVNTQPVGSGAKGCGCGGGSAGNSTCGGR
ncbi:MAG: sulfite exporter TauE/SafE family protein [Candidatus Shapirobacteria bacterium]|jgi:sulfite exporter TauE/SafE/copper chaperone CopZ